MDDIYARHGHLEKQYLNAQNLAFLQDQDLIAQAYQDHYMAQQQALEEAISQLTEEPSENEVLILQKTKIDEKGKYKVLYDNGDEYIGVIQDDLKDGEGELILVNKDRYEGFFQNDLFHGFGRYFYVNGGSYEGDFYEGKRQGFGILRYQDIHYEGEFYDDDFDGPGKLKNKEGYYEGVFKNGLKQGDGVLKEKDGNVIIGTWNDGEQIN